MPWSDGVGPSVSSGSVQAGSRRMSTTSGNVRAMIMASVADRLGARRPAAPDYCFFAVNVPSPRSPMVTFPFIDVASTVPV